MPWTEVDTLPRKPKHPCAFSGCPNLADARFCAEHSLAEHRRYNRYQRDPDSAKRYDGDWNRTSKAYRMAHPLCEVCKECGHLTPAALVHHKRKLTDGGSNDWDNLQALCQPCHSKLHADQGDRWG